MKTYWAVNAMTPWNKLMIDNDELNFPAELGQFFIPVFENKEDAEREAEKCNTDVSEFTSIAKDDKYAN